jgi:hypothetical protein
VQLELPAAALVVVVVVVVAVVALVVVVVVVKETEQIGKGFFVIIQSTEFLQDARVRRVCGRRSRTEEQEGDAANTYASSCGGACPRGSFQSRDTSN